MDDQDGFDGEVPEELKAWFDSQRESNRLGMYVLKNGKIKAATMEELAASYADFNTRMIDRTTISEEPKIYVSTVFLGIDHNFGWGQKPILFETMVFGGKFDQRMWRYASYGEAKNGHWCIVDCIRAGKPPHVSFGERPAIELFLEMFRDERESESDSTPLDFRDSDEEDGEVG